MYHDKAGRSISYTEYPWRTETLVNGQVFMGGPMKGGVYPLAPFGRPLGYEGGYSEMVALVRDRTPIEYEGYGHPFGDKVAEMFPKGYIPQVGDIVEERQLLNDNVPHLVPLESDTPCYKEAIPSTTVVRCVKVGETHCNGYAGRTVIFKLLSPA